MKERPWCDCMRICEPLAGTDSLPEHLCPETARASWESWFYEQTLDLAGSGEDRWAKQRSFDTLSLGAGRYVRREETEAGPVLRVHTSERRVLCILRQWAEEEPDEKFMEMLEKECAQLAKRLKRQLFTAEAMDRFHRETLGGFGLPLTPATQNWLVAGRTGPGFGLPAPTRGVLVTSYAIEGSEFGALPEASCNIEAPALSWVTKSLERSAWDLAEKHEAWLKKHLALELPSTDRAALNQGRPVENVERAEKARACLAGLISEDRYLDFVVARAREQKGEALKPEEKKRVLGAARDALRHQRKKVEKERAHKQLK